MSSICKNYTLFAAFFSCIVSTIKGNDCNSHRVLDRCDSVPVNGHSAQVSLKHLEIPATNPNEIINHAGYSLRYNEKHEQAEWVAYELTKDETQKGEDRTNNFRPDPSIKSGSADNSDYAGSGYDRGHLAPAADMSWSQKSMDESFYFSNMSPQVPSFNRGIWKRLEEQVRSWATQLGSIYVVTGPVLQDGLPAIGANQVSIPKYYYKVILDFNEPGIHGIGLLLENAASSENLEHYVVSIDSVETLTGIDFFPQLPDDKEKKIEKEVCVSCWSWGGVHGNTNTGQIPHANQHPADNKTHDSQTNQNEKAAVQCSGTTKSGTRCKRMTQSSNGKCYQHGGN